MFFLFLLVQNGARAYVWIIGGKGWDRMNIDIRMFIRMGVV